VSLLINLCLNYFALQINSHNTCSLYVTFSALNVSNPDLMASFLTMALDPTASVQIRRRLDEPVGKYLTKILVEQENEFQRILQSKNISMQQLYLELAFG
jgi:hypothetical protein